MNRFYRSLCLVLMLIFIPTMSWGKEIEIGATKPSDTGKLYWITGRLIEQPRFMTDGENVTIIDRHNQSYPLNVPEPATPTSSVRKVTAWSSYQPSPEYQAAQQRSAGITRAIETQDGTWKAAGYSASQRVDLLVDFLKHFPDSAEVINPHRTSENAFTWMARGLNYQSLKVLSDEVPLSTMSISTSVQESQHQQVKSILDALRSGCNVMIGWKGQYSIRPPLQGADGKNPAMVYMDLPPHVATAMQSRLSLDQLRQLARR